MKVIAVKLPEETIALLMVVARATGRTVAALLRERLEAGAEPRTGSVYAITSDLAGCLGGRRRAAGNERRKFRRS
jgi:hypothetical protein